MTNHTDDAIADPAAVVLDGFRRRGWTLATAESLSGGLVAAAITAVPGASDVFVGSVVSYATSVKRELLGVVEQSVVSRNAALEMANGACRVLDADVAVALTGVAGPTQQDGQPVGTVWIAVVGPDIEAVQRAQLDGTRNEIRAAACDVALRELLACCRD